MSAKHVITRVENGAAVIYPGIYLNQLRGESIENNCHGLLAEGIKKIIIDVKDTELVNSIGISLLLGVIDAVGEAGGFLILSSLNESNRELFEMLGLLSYVRVEQDEESALHTLCQVEANR
jgi:anti-anti-sigma factor